MPEEIEDWRQKIVQLIPREILWDTDLDYQDPPEGLVEKLQAEEYGAYSIDGFTLRLQGRITVELRDHPDRIRLILDVSSAELT